MSKPTNDIAQLQRLHWDSTRYFFAYQLVVCRLKAKLTIEEAATEIGVSAHSMTAFENGNIGRLTLLHIAALASLYDTAPLVRLVPYPVPLSYPEETASRRP